ncbi:MAG: Pr6Pr family membrane protein [Thermoleophilia bacterium]|nr:Pr6Pr family membrane protein [Thermoleophilia bacterium]
MPDPHRNVRANHPAVRALRLALAGLISAAIISQLTQVGSAAKAANFFSFFTIETNVLVVAVLIWGAVRRRDAATSARYEPARGAATLFILLVGVAFARLLADVSRDLGLTLPWVNRVVHYISPALLALDYLLVAPTSRLRWRSAFAWLAFPLAYLIFTFVRGGIIDWYPYPFLDHRLVGWSGVARHSIGIAMGVIVAAPAIIAIGNHAAPDASEPAGRRHGRPP